MAYPQALPSLTAESASQWYTAAVGSAAVVLLYTHAARFLFTSGLVPLQPLGVVAAIIGLALPLLLLPRHLGSLLKSPLLIWGGLYAGLTIAGFFLSAQGDVARQELLRRLLSTLLLWSLVLVYADERNHGLIRAVVVGAALAGVCFNLLDILRPLTFSPIAGRAAGLYVNPNISGSALVVGLVLGTERCSPRFRSWFVLLIGLGVAMTLSRAAIITWVIAAAGLYRHQGFSLWKLVRGAVAVLLAVLAIAEFTGRLPLLLEAADLLASPDLSRLTLAGEVQAGGTASVTTRLDVARLALRMFSDQPLTGQGIGATSDLLYDQGSHNVYLRDLAEYGILGILIMPLFALSTTWGGTGRVRGTARTFAVFLLLWGLSSHDILDEWQFLIGAGLMSSMCLSSRKETGSAEPVNV